MCSSIPSIDPTVMLYSLGATSTQISLVHVQLMTATDFLSKIHPLKHTAVQRKSSVHHAMCEMLTAILIHLVRENRPR